MVFCSLLMGLNCEIVFLVTVNRDSDQKREMERSGSREKRSRGCVSSSPLPCRAGSIA